jgi:hypothetical protein
MSKKEMAFLTILLLGKIGPPLYATMQVHVSGMQAHAIVQIQKLQGDTPIRKGVRDSLLGHSMNVVG